MKVSNTKKTKLKEVKNKISQQNKINKTKEFKNKITE